MRETRRRFVVRVLVNGVAIFSAMAGIAFVAAVVVPRFPWLGWASIGALALFLGWAIAVATIDP